jgi:hypothetical protein
MERDGGNFEEQPRGRGQQRNHRHWTNMIRVLGHLNRKRLADHG